MGINILNVSEVGRGDDGSVAVIMPVHNAERYLSESIQSILSQTFTDFQLIIVDDGSRDASWSIIESFDDNRIVKVRFDESRGIVSALNTALRMTDSEFIARMDADDVARDDRFQKQLEFLRSRPDVGVCGSAIRIVKGRFSCYARYPETHDEIICSLAIYKRAVCHPSVMLRRSVLDREEICYTSDYRHVEDLSLWHGLAQKTRFHNLREPLLAYRMHSEQVSTRYNASQMDQTQALINTVLSEYFPSLPLPVREDFLRLLAPKGGSKRIDRVRMDLPGLYADMVSANRVDGKMPSNIFSKVLISKLFEIVLQENYGLRNTLFAWSRTVFKDPALFLDVARRAQLSLNSSIFHSRVA